MKILENVLSTFISIPFLPWVILMILCSVFIKPKKKAKRLALEISTIFFLFAVDVYTNVLFGLKIFPYLLLGVLLIGFIFTLLQWKIREEVKFVGVIKSTMRVTFVLTFISYLGLTFYGLTTYIMKYIS